MNDQPATRKDVEEIVGRVVGEIVGDALGHIDERFKQQDLEIQDVKATVNRIEGKLDATADKVDDHEVRIKTLEQKPA